ncbi:YcbX family protein [Thalassotalea sp. G2M2-11]|uniref:YcbX family protein n=1 Tax=Thalassotalea sp. G2M2-11 TaxID=2787627 RepID=UPI0019D1A389|nr:YcbX family protein [Thalassotalea sp. G2M2-11]
MTSPISSSLHIYPIKSSAGIALSNAWVDSYGFSFDRRFVVTDTSGQFITARTEPSLCLVQANLTPTGLILTAPNMPILEINYGEFSQYYSEVTVWNDQIASQHCHHDYDAWFSEYLGRSCQLHYFGKQSTRRVKHSDKQLGFADGYPLLLISQASLDDLNQRLGQDAVTMAQFRPNIVVANTEPFAEDGWKKIRIGEVTFEVVKPCSRCVFTTVDPHSAKPHQAQQPLATLKQYRQVASGDVMFGQNLIALNQGQIKQGDDIEILATQDKPVFLSKASSEDNNVEKKPEFEVPKKVNILFDSWDKYHQGNSKEPILDQGESAGLVLPYSCRGGMCGRCKLKLESGKVKQLATDGLTDDEKAQGYILACSSIPQSDIVVSKG